MEDYTREFIDVISKINNLGKERGFKNGLDMAETGLEKGILTQSEFNDYKNLHNIRNGGGHGFMGDLRIRKRTFAFVEKIYFTLKRSNLRSSGGHVGRSHHEHGEERIGGRGKRDFRYINDYYRSRGYDIRGTGTKKNELDDGPIGDCTARLDDNRLEVTVESCEKTLFGYFITLSIVDARSELVEIKLCNDNETFYSTIVEVSANKRKIVGASFKHWPLREIEIGLNDHYARYSIARHKMM